jgi:pilus assembly protein CpaB
LQHPVILPADVMRPGDHGFLAAVLTPGRRATSVGVDAVSGTAGLIWPGDHVDLILTQDVNDGRTNGQGTRVAAETVLRDVRVIAIDQQLVQGGGAGGEGAGSRTVTLEVTPEEVEKVAVASHLGRLTLAVRPVDAAPSDQNAQHPVTYAKDVSNAYAPPAKGGEVPSTTMVIHSGTADKEYHF